MDMSRKQNRYCTKTECQESDQVTEYQVITIEKYSLNYSYLYSYSDFYCLLPYLQHTRHFLIMLYSYN